jgi:hypothetical protein
MFVGDHLMAAVLTNIHVNVSLTYYFETLLLSRDVSSPWLCNVNKDGGVGE